MKRPTVLSLSLPLMLSTVLQTGYQIVNTFWVGRLGAPAVAAVSVSFPIVFLLISLGGGMAIAGSILASQYAGARNYAMVNRVSAQTLLVVLGVAALLSALGYAVTPYLLRFMAIEPGIFSDAVRYLRVSFLGIVFLFSYSMFQSILRGIGEVRMPLFIVTGGVLLNAVLDPLFIFGWGPVPAGGVEGAAWATLVTQGLAATVGLWILFSGRYGIELKRRHLRPDLALVGRVLRLGFPASVEQSAQAIGMTVLTVFVTGFGTVATAAYGIAYRIFTFAVIPAFAVSMAVATLVGHSIGARDANRAQETTQATLRAMFVVLLGVSAALFLGAGHILRFFVPTDPQVVTEGIRALQSMAISSYFLGMQLVLSGALRGAGATYASMALAIVTTWGVQIPATWILTRYAGLGADGVWLMFPLANLAGLAATLLWFKRGTWQKGALRTDELQERVTREILLEEGR